MTFTFSSLADQLFMLQHTLFVGQYARVGVSISRVFCHQSDQVVAELRFRLRLIAVAEAFMLVCLVISFIIQLAFDA